MTALLRTDDDVLEAYRARIRELGITHSTVDSIAGWADGWTSKIMCGMKKPGQKTRDTLNQTLGMAFVVVEDEEAKARVQARWIKRRRPLRKSVTSASTSASPVDMQSDQQLQAKLQRQEWGKMGAKRRMKIMGKRARQRSASHAARMRWSRRGTGAATA